MDRRRPFVAGNVFLNRIDAPLLQSRQVSGRGISGVTLRPDKGMSGDEEAALWKSYDASREDSVRERLVQAKLPFAKIIAAKVYAGRHHDEFEFNEYLQFAVVGLMESIDRFDPERGANFGTYAGRRMIGAILSGLEKLSEKQQQISFRQRLISERVASLKPESKPDIASFEQLFSCLADVGFGLALGYMLDGSGMIDEGERSAVASQYDRLEMKQLQQRIRHMLTTLPEMEQRVIRYHYLQNMPFQEIAARCALTKGRISQLHRNALALLGEEIRQTRRCDVAW
jgi:RNA polymerase sigma factor for flagellar operon FliA